MIVACSILEHKGTHETVEEPLNSSDTSDRIRAVDNRKKS
jgi:hypothetical protein